MKIRGIWLVFASLAAVVSALMPPASYAGERKAFFEENNANQIFDSSVLNPDSSGIEYFLPVRANKDSFSINKSEVKPIPTANPSIVQSLHEKYGDPTKDVPVTAIESAPKPFQAMMDAKQAGQDELALEYARQYVRYLRSLKDRNKYISGLIGAAMQDEGMLPDNSWPSSPEFEEIHRLKERVKNNTEQQKDTGLVDVATLDESTKDLLRKASEDEDYPMAALSKSPNFKLLDENIERQKLRQQFVVELPRDAQGKISAYLFLRPEDQKSMFALQQFAAMQAKYADNKRVTFSAFSVEISSPDRIANLRRMFNIPFGIKNGGDLSNSLGVKQVPAVILVSESSGQSVRFEGVKPDYFLDEALKVMGGLR